MTSSEMIQNFKMHYDIVNLEGPGYEDEEILVFINQAQIIELMKEISIRRWTNITRLIQNEILSTVKPVIWSEFDYHTQVTACTDYLAYISSRSKITRSTFKTTNGEEWVGNIFITKEQAPRYTNNRNNRVILIVPRVYEDIAESGTYTTLSILYDSNTTFSELGDFELEYIRKPVVITDVVDCEINEIMHERIVLAAVDLAKKVFNPQEAGLSQQADQLMHNPRT
jgi:hypothetical protein